MLRFNEHTRPVLIADEVPDIAVVRAIQRAKLHAPARLLAGHVKYLRDDAVLPRRRGHVRPVVEKVHAVR